MVGREADSISYADEEISSSSFEDVPYSVDTVRIITWLRSIEEARADALWKRLFLSSQCPGFVSFLGASFRVLYGGRPKEDELQVLSEGSYK